MAGGNEHRTSRLGDHDSIQTQTSTDVLTRNVTTHKSPLEITRSLPEALRQRVDQEGGLTTQDCLITWKPAYISLHLEFTLQFIERDIVCQHLLSARHQSIDDPARYALTLLQESRKRITEEAISTQEILNHINATMGETTNTLWWQALTADTKRKQTIEEARKINASEDGIANLEISKAERLAEQVNTGALDQELLKQLVAPAQIVSQATRVEALEAETSAATLRNRRKTERKRAKKALLRDTQASLSIQNLAGAHEEEQSGQAPRQSGIAQSDGNTGSIAGKSEEATQSAQHYSGNLKSESEVIANKDTKSSLEQTGEIPIGDTIKPESSIGDNSVGHEDTHNILQPSNENTTPLDRDTTALQESWKLEESLNADIVIGNQNNAAIEDSRKSEQLSKPDAVAIESNSADSSKNITAIEEGLKVGQPHGKDGAAVNKDTASINKNFVAVDNDMHPIYDPPNPERSFDKKFGSADEHQTSSITKYDLSSEDSAKVDTEAVAQQDESAIASEEPAHPDNESATIHANAEHDIASTSHDSSQSQEVEAEDSSDGEDATTPTQESFLGRSTTPTQSNFSNLGPLSGVIGRDFPPSSENPPNTEIATLHNMGDIVAPDLHGRPTSLHHTLANEVVNADQPANIALPRNTQTRGRRRRTRAIRRNFARVAGARSEPVLGEEEKPVTTIEYTTDGLGFPCQSHLQTKAFTGGARGLKWAYATHTAADREMLRAGLWLFEKPQGKFQAPDETTTRQGPEAVKAPVVVMPYQMDYPNPMMEFDGCVSYITPHATPRADIRSVMLHPDFQTSAKLLEYQASELAGERVWRHDRDLLTCRFTGCRAQISDHNPTHMICLGCGPKTTIRYCSQDHLLADVHEHWRECGNHDLLMKQVIDHTTEPARFSRLCPWIRDRKGIKSFALHRQRLYAMIYHGHYTLFDWEDGTSVPLIWPQNDPNWKEMESRVERLLNLAFLDRGNRMVVIHLFRLLRTCLQMKEGGWVVGTEYALTTQIWQEFGVDVSNSSEINTGLLCECEWVGDAIRNREHVLGCTTMSQTRSMQVFVEQMEARFWILRAWRRQHPEVGHWRVRAAGYGFTGLEEEQALALGPGWLGAAAEEDNICR